MDGNAVRNPVLDVLAGRPMTVPPVWMMRQAGRYLPEYRALRAKAGSFLDLCFNPEMAADVTLQPIHRFGFDAAILFSDILVIPHALGQTVRFAVGEGPQLAPLQDAAAIDRLPAAVDQAILAPVYDTVRRVRASLDPSVALLGFCGAPWTAVSECPAPAAHWPCARRDWRDRSRLVSWTCGIHRPARHRPPRGLRCADHRHASWCS